MSLARLFVFLVFFSIFWSHRFAASALYTYLAFNSAPPLFFVAEVALPGVVAFFFLRLSGE